MEPVERREERFAAVIAALSRAVNLRAAGGTRGKEAGASDLVDNVQGNLDLLQEHTCALVVKQFWPKKRIHI